MLTENQVFESVIPSERTCIEFKFINSAVRVIPPSKPSALLLSLEDVGFSTDLSSHTPEIAATTVGSGLSILLVDDVDSLLTVAHSRSLAGTEHWRVSHLTHRTSLVAELPIRMQDTHLSFILASTM